MSVIEQPGIPRRLMRVVTIVLACGIFVGCQRSDQSSSSSSPQHAPADSILDLAFDQWGYFSDNENRCDSATRLLEVVAETLADPASMTWQLDSLENHAQIVYSDDSTMRVVSWLAPCSGTMRRYPSVVCVWDASGRYSVHKLPAEWTEKSVSFSLGAVTNIYHLHDSLYLTTSVGQLMGSMPYETAGVVVCSADTIHPADFRFYADYRSFSSLMLDKSWYMKHLSEYNHEIPSIIAYDRATRTMSFPTIRTSKGERVLDNVYGEPGMTVDTTEPTYLRLVDSAFVEVEHSSGR